MQSDSIQSELLALMALAQTDAMLAKESTVLSRDTVGDFTVSTIRCTDTCIDPYETAIKHPEFNQGRPMIVASYKTSSAAAVGHGEWCGRLMNGPPPERFREHLNSRLSRLTAAFGDGPEVYEREAR